MLLALVYVALIIKYKALISYLLCKEYSLGILEREKITRNNSTLLLMRVYYLTGKAMQGVRLSPGPELTRD